MSAPDGDEAVNEIEGTDEAEATLTALIKAAFPHERVPDSAYRRAADTVRCAAEESAWMRVKLAHGLDSLEALADGRFTELSPEEALPEILGRGRTPLTISEGISWLLQDPARLEPNHCFMTIASRKPKKTGALDKRTPGIWIGGGSPRDGKERDGAPKVGWCWSGNRHSWLGIASADGRRPLA